MRGGKRRWWEQDRQEMRNDSAESFPGDDSPIDAMAFISANDDRGLVLGHVGGVRVHERILH